LPSGSLATFLNDSRIVDRRSKGPSGELAKHKRSGNAVRICKSRVDICRSATVFSRSVGACLGVKYGLQSAKARRDRPGLLRNGRTITQKKAARQEAIARLLPWRVAFLRSHSHPHQVGRTFDGGWSTLGHPSFLRCAFLRPLVRLSLWPNAAAKHLRPLYVQSRCPDPRRRLSKSLPPGQPKLSNIVDDTP